MPNSKVATSQGDSAAMHSGPIERNRYGLLPSPSESLVALNKDGARLVQTKIHLFWRLFPHSHTLSYICGFLQVLIFPAEHFQGHWNGKSVFVLLTRLAYTFAASQSLSLGLVLTHWKLFQNPAF
ncbi:hypothetical protein C8R43DRAFT_1047169 [Mycena crocata]|nr:hypothetical protein C8R43DRAFT_1047169 [Mycena crocata]